jgi:hypothetical protein
MDLFAGPDQKSLEALDAGNPMVAIVEAEGSGPAFGGEAAPGAPAVDIGQGVPVGSPKARAVRKPKAGPKS